MSYTLIAGLVYALGFLVVFLGCLCQNDDQKLGIGPNRTKFFFGLIFGILWLPIAIMGLIQWIFQVGAYEKID